MHNPPELRADHEFVIQKLFEKQARSSPDSIALSLGVQALTYRGLNEKANQLAGYLRGLGVQPETPVALLLERSFDLVVAILAVLKAGGVYVPIDPACPPERVRFTVSDSGSTVLLTHSLVPSDLPPLGAIKVNLDSSWPEAAKFSGKDPDCTVSGRNAAYVIYTSGSTGRPKGVVVTHRNVVRLFQATQHWFDFGPRDVWPLFHSCAFDMSVWELWGALAHGGRLIIVPRATARSPHEFYDLLARERISILNQTPSAFRQLIWAEHTAPVKHRLHLRFVTCGGEALDLQSLRPWFEFHGDHEPVIVNMYGITETTVHATYRPIRKGDLERGMGSVIGVPIPDLRVHLLDENLQPVCPGETGEICIGGPGVARGYLNRPELTAERFLDTDLGRLYRSGDLARFNSHGELEYLGRADCQVKLRGFRIELGEIESALSRHPSVRENCVVLREDVPGEKRLVAYVVAADGIIRADELNNSLASLLPEYMRPAAFVFLDRLPLTNNGKVDRRALPPPSTARPELQTSFQAPRTDIERAVAEVWKRVLHLEDVGVHDSFFDLGGDSIRALAVTAGLREKGFKVDFAALFRHPTIADLAATAESVNLCAPVAVAAPLAMVPAADRAHLPAHVEDAYPLSSLQLGMFFHNELDPASAIYHDVFSYHIGALFRRDLFQRAVDLLLKRHPTLRTSFLLAGFTEPMQLVHPQVSAPLTLEDLCSLHSSEQEAAVQRWIETEKRRAFDRTQPPLARFHVQLRNEHSFQLFISFHHSCMDGWSLAVAVTELLLDYSALLEGKVPPGQTPAAHFRDYVRLEQESASAVSTRDFWVRKLKDLEPGELPRWPEKMRARGREQVRGPAIRIEEQLLAAVRKVARLAGVPLKTLLLAAHQRVMACLYGKLDVVTGLVTNGRPEVPDADRLIGLFLNTIPLRQTVSDISWLEWAQQTFAAEQELLPHRRFPLAQIQKLHGHPLFETAFDFVHFRLYERLQRHPCLTFAEEQYFEANNLVSYTTFLLDPTGTRLELHIDYDPNSLSARQIQELTDYYVETLRAMAADPAGSCLKFSPLSGEERNRLLVTWNHTACAFPVDRCIHELFEARADTCANRIAVTGSDGSLTYSELNEAATHIARGLRLRGVQPGDPVGICFERSSRLVAALLGILKTGAAYVPLDPALPVERMALMLGDSGARLLLTQDDLVPRLPALVSVATLDELASASNGLSVSPSPLRREPVANDVAYVLYTSGSTGTPKGVPVEHRSVVNLLYSVAAATGVTGEDHLLAVTTISFDIAALEVFLPLLMGGRVTLSGAETAADGRLLARAIEEIKPTLMQATPATWRMLIQAGWDGAPGLKVFSGGETLAPSLAYELLRRTLAVWNFYGPTETTIWSTAARILPGEPVTIGRPLANTRVYILGPDGLPVPTGTAGQLYIGGDGVARGYLNQPNLTAERFVPDPFHRLPARMYKTGDLARYLPDGQIEFLGRSDFQLKVRGFRIEPGEVESVLRRHKAVADALVTARDDGSGEKRLVGYLISKNGPPSFPELCEFLKTRLPFYMVPTQFMVVSRFPRTASGKVDLRRLPAPVPQLQPALSRVTPRDREERALAEIWKDVLHLKEVCIDDNFFELGGESLSATRAFARISRALGVEVPLKKIFEQPTIRQLAQVVRESGNRPAENREITRQKRMLVISDGLRKGPGSEAGILHTS